MLFIFCLRITFHNASIIFFTLIFFIYKINQLVINTLNVLQKNNNKYILS